jgi:hypothetical protein
MSGETTSNRLTQNVGRPAAEPDLVPSGSTLDYWSSEAWANGIQTEQLEDMQKLFVRTKNSLFEITIIDRWTGDILVRGGQFFPELTPVCLAGATLGGSFLKVRGIYVGFQMEITSVDADLRVLTTRVRTIAVETADGGVPWK